MNQIFKKGISRVLAGMILFPVFLMLISFSQTPLASATDSSSSQVNVDLVNGIAIRILNSAATSEIENLNLSIDPVPGGVFTSGNFNVEVSTSNKTGYKLYMNSGTSSTALINQIDSSFTIPSISSAATSSSFTPNTWGYSLDSTNYNPIPANGDPDQVKYTATPSASDLTPVTVGMNVDMSKASGIYSNQLTFTAVAEAIPITYTLDFNANTGGSAPSSISSTATSGSATFTIPDHTPYKDSNGFKGWSESASSETGSGSGPNGLYEPGDTITVTAEGWDDMTKTLYAIWTTPTFWNISAMQQMTTSICNSVYTPSNATSATNPAVQVIDNQAEYEAAYTAAGSTVDQPYVAQRILYDIRDTNNNEYVIRKLADGNCWMTENLKLVGNATVGYTDLTTTDSDVPAAGFRLAASTAQDYTWCTDNSAACDNQSMVLNSGSDTYGSYYNWYAATAGTGTYEKSSGSVSYSICPRGWRLPTGGSSGEFQTLYGYYNSASAMMSADGPAFVLSGVRYGSSTSGQGSSGYYWSSTARNSNAAYRLYLNSSDVYPADYSNKYGGLAVRCVAN